MRSAMGHTGNSIYNDTAGELLATNHANIDLTTVGAGTVTAGMVAAGIVRRTGPVGGFTDTFPGAEELRLALGSPPAGSAFFFVYQNAVAQAMTFAAGVGITTVGTVSVAASVTRLYNVRIINETPQTVVLGTTTNASAVISGLTAAQVAAISVGQAVSGTGIGASAVVLSKNEAAGTVTLSANSTATANNISITFSPVIQFHGLGVMTA